MEGKNSHAATITKHLSSQPVVQCPWTSKAPLNAVIGLKSNPNPNNSQTTNGQKCNFQNMHPTPEKEVAPTVNIPLQHSSSQFFHFLRLMQLFPDVHPATLHSVMTLCKNDFFGAVDKLLYAKRCKNYYMNQRGNYQQTKTTQQRYQPYNNNGNMKKSNDLATQHNTRTTNDVATNYPNASGCNDYSTSYYIPEIKPVDLKTSNESKGIDSIPPLLPLKINAIPATISTKPAQPPTTLISGETTLISL